MHSPCHLVVKLIQVSVPGVNVEVLVGVWLKKTSVNLKVVVHNCPGLELGRSVVVQMI